MLYKEIHDLVHDTLVYICTVVGDKAKQNSHDYTSLLQTRTQWPPIPEY